VITRRSVIGTVGFALGGATLWATLFGTSGKTMTDTMLDNNFLPASNKFPLNLTDAEWHKRLTLAEYKILRQEGTETPFTSPLNDEHRRGVFVCAGCDQKLFSSETKFESGTGWPSFFQPLPNAVVERTDGSSDLARTEVHCANCGCHLGHVFDDGPPPTGLRYCMNGLALKFQAV